MSQIIAQHALVLLPDDARQSCCDLFPLHEYISLERVQRDLIGYDPRPEMAQIIQHELRRRVGLKLSLGERVVVETHGLPQGMQIALARDAHGSGASLCALAPNATQSRLEWLRRDYGGDILDPALTPLTASQRLPEDTLPYLRDRYRGITVVGDLHGDADALRTLRTWARSRENYVWYLGDMLDYGPDSLPCIDQIYADLMQGRASCLIGNHERKIAKWLSARDDGDARSVRLSPGNRATTTPLNALGPVPQKQWIGRFRSVLGRASLLAHVGRFTLAHAGVHPGLWTGQASDAEIEQFALFGESRLEPGTREFTLSYRWVDQVPAGTTVLVGHDTRSTTVPMVVQGRAGGTVAFLDTGCGKGGGLSSADLRFRPDGSLHLENFNRH